MTAETHNSKHEELGPVTLPLNTPTPEILMAILARKRNVHVTVPFADDDSAEALIARVRTGLSRARKSARRKLGDKMQHFKLGSEVDETNRVVVFWKFQSRNDAMHEALAVSNVKF